MKKALIIGGSSGIGLALASQLIQKGYFIEILSRKIDELTILPNNAYRHTFCDLYDFNEDLILSFANDPEIELLMITAGIGRVADFQAHHIAEIDKIITIDTISTIKILRIFYDRINSNLPFYVGVMGSICGWMSSPAASVYAAAKAGVVRFIESVNIELEENCSVNRILDISPGSFEGSKFNGGMNNNSCLIPLARNIIVHLFNHDTLFIPQYEELFRGVLESYHSNSHDYGLYSYKFKRESDRFDNRKKVIIGYLSGTFDLFHIGHLNLLKRAKSQCDYLIVGVHDSGAWKGKETFIPFDERKEIVAGCKYVNKVVDSCVEDSDAWEMWHFDRLFVGSDYKGSERFQKYETFFKSKGVDIIYFPYTKTTSSTQIRNNIKKNQMLC